MLAAPALNPAALALTFLLFPPHLGWARLALSLVLVLGASAAIGRAFEVPSAPPARRSTPRPPACAASREGSAWRSATSAVARFPRGILVSAALAGFVPVASLSGAPGGALAVTLVVAAIAVPIALRTFAEIPVALALFHAGAPEGAVLALLVGGPAINLPSLLTVRTLTSWRVAAATAAAVFATTVLAGLALDPT